MSLLWSSSLTIIMSSSYAHANYSSVAQITGLAPLHPIVVTLDPLPLLMATLPLLIHVTTFVQEIIGMITTITLVHILPPGNIISDIKTLLSLHLALTAFILDSVLLPHLLVVIKAQGDTLHPRLHHPQRHRIRWSPLHVVHHPLVSIHLPHRFPLLSLPLVSPLCAVL